MTEAPARHSNPFWPRDDQRRKTSWSRALQNAGYDKNCFDNGLSAYNRLLNGDSNYCPMRYRRRKWTASNWPAAPPNSIPDIRSCSSPKAPPVALNPDNHAPKRANPVETPSWTTTSSPRCSSLWQPEAKGRFGRLRSDKQPYTQPAFSQRRVHAG